MMNTRQAIAMAGAVLGTVLTAGCGLGLGPLCETDADCDDGIFCNGAEICALAVCVESEPPCGTFEETGLRCDEQTSGCFEPREPAREARPGSRAKPALLDGYAD